MPSRIVAAYALITLAALALRWIYGDGFIASDDIGYTEFAARLAAGDLTPQPHHYWSRYGVTVPVALLVFLFGISEWVTHVLPLLASTASVLMLMRIADRLFDTRAAIVAGTLYATFPVQLHNATTLLPEPPAGFLALCAIYLYIVDAPTTRRLFVVGLLMGLGIWAKEPVLFVLLALVGHSAVTGAATRGISMLLGAAAIGAVELVYHYATTGDPFFRLNSMGVHEVSQMAIAANEDLSYRLLKAYPRMMLVPDERFGAHSLFALLVGVAGWFTLDKSRRWLFLLWCALPFLYLNFGSSSLSKYLALPVAPRYIEFLYPPLFLSSGALISTIWPRRTVRSIAVLALMAVCVIGVFAAASNQYRNPTLKTVAELRRVALQAKAAGLSAVDIDVALPPTGSIRNRWVRAFRILAPDIEIRAGAPTRIDVGADGSVALSHR